MEQSKDFGGTSEHRRNERPADDGSTTTPAAPVPRLDEIRNVASMLERQQSALDRALDQARNQPSEQVRPEPAAGIEVDSGIEVAEEPETAPVYGPSKLPSGSTCEICGSEQAEIRINVDGNTLLMESCDGCDIRRWQLAGERIDLQEALNQVGEHSGRRR